MIKLKDILSEANDVRINYKSLKGVGFNVRAHGSSIIFTAKTIKDSELLDTLELAPYQIQEELVSYCESKLRGFKFSPDYRYPGAGYAVELDLDSLINKL